MPISTDAERGSILAPLLRQTFLSKGIHGRNDMPEDILPEGMKRGSTDHILFLTLTVSIDYQRDASALWESARNTFEDRETRYLFDPHAIHETESGKIISDMQRYGLSKKPRLDARIWRTNALTFLKKWSGDPMRFLADCGNDAPEIISRLRKDTHFDGYRNSHDYLFLKGKKIAPLWLRMLRDNAGMQGIKNLDKIPIPVDVHVARASLALGVVRGTYSGPPEEIYEAVRKVWRESTLMASAQGQDIISLDIDEALWHLSRYGCSGRSVTGSECPQKSSCEFWDFCMDGIVQVSADEVTIDT